MLRGAGVQLYWTGEHAKGDAISYAKERAKFGCAEIRALNHDGKVETIIPIKAFANCFPWHHRRRTSELAPEEISLRPTPT